MNRIENKLPNSRQMQLQTPSQASIASMRHFRDQNKDSGQVNSLLTDQYAHKQQSTFLPDMRIRKNHSNIVISDDTYCMMKQSDLRSENRSGRGANQMKIQNFDKSGTNVIPMGARGKNEIAKLS